VLKEANSRQLRGTAALALGNLKTGESMAALVDGLQRFPGEGSFVAALATMGSTVNDILGNPAHKYLASAISASRYLEAADRTAALSRLYAIIENAVQEDARLATHRLMAEAKGQTSANSATLLEVSSST
jgi:hypothetical protein